MRLKLNDEIGIYQTENGDNCVHASLYQTENGDNCHPGDKK